MLFRVLRGGSKKMLRKIFYTTFCLGILLLLALLVLLPVEIVVNFDADGLPQDVGSKWIFVAIVLLFQVCILVFHSVAPLCINHAYRAEVWKENSMNTFRLFLPSNLMNEAKMRKLRERTLDECHWISFFCVPSLVATCHFVKNMAFG